MITLWQTELARFSQICHSSQTGHGSAGMKFVHVMSAAHMGKLVVKMIFSA